jgi:regulatory protein
MLEQVALGYLARRDRTEAQMRAYLNRKGGTASRIRSLIVRFREHGYLNDAAYAMRWACARLERQPMGAVRLEAELGAQGFDEATIARTLTIVYRERRPRDLARELLRRRIKGTVRDPRRMNALLRRHGFEEDVIETFVRSSDES